MEKLIHQCFSLVFNNVFYSKLFAYVTFPSKREARTNYRNGLSNTSVICKLHHSGAFTYTFYDFSISFMTFNQYNTSSNHTVYSKNRAYYTYDLNQNA